MEVDRSARRARTSRICLVARMARLFPGMELGLGWGIGEGIPGRGIEVFGAEGLGDFGIAWDLELKMNKRREGLMHGLGVGA